jgi:sporulation related protein
MSMAENRRNRPQSSDDAYAPQQNEPSDPLAELARLIGQSDPYTDLQGRARKPLDGLGAGERPVPELRATPEWLPRPSAPPAPPPQSYNEPHYDDRYQDDRAHDPQGHDAYAGEYHDDAGDNQGHYPAQAYPAQAYQADDRYRVTPPPPADYDDGYYAEDGHMPPHGEEGFAPAARRGGLVTIAAVVGLAVIGTAGAFAYRSFTGGPAGSTNPPLIKADPTPPKIVPQASLAAADAQNKPFQDRIGDGAERMVPREEQPVSLPVPPRPTVAAPQTAFPPAPGAPMAAPPAAPNASLNQPKRVRTETIRPDSLAATEPAPAPAPQAPAAAPVRQPAAKQGTPPMAIAPQSDAPSRAKVAVRTPPAQAAGGPYSIQLSSQKTEEDAKSSYEVAQQKYPSVLSGREATIRRVEVANETRYRVRVGAFATLQQAEAFCKSLQDVGGQCLPVKN